MTPDHYVPRWTSFEEAGAEDWQAVMAYEEQFNAQLVDRILAMLALLDEEDTPYPLNRYQHSLQAATRAYNDGAEEEIVVAALIHDIGDILSPYNHGELAAAMVRPYMSERACWIIEHHCVFQGYYYNHFLGGDRNARDKYRDSPHYEAAVHFCHEYDQKAFDPDYPCKPLSFFEPMLRRIFSKRGAHMELLETADD